MEIARNGNCGTVLQGVENAAQASMDSQRSLSTTLVLFSVVVCSLHVDWLHTGLPLSFLSWAYALMGVYFWEYGTPRMSIFGVFVRLAFPFLA